MSNLGAATEIEEVDGKAKMESAAASVPASEGTTKHKRKRKKLRMNQEVANASDSRVVQPEATSIVAAGQASEGIPKLKRKKETKAKEGKMAEHDATTKVVSASEGMPKLKRKKETKAKEGKMAKQDATTKVVSALEGAPKLNKKKKKKAKAKEGEREEQEVSTKVVSAFDETPKHQEEVKERGMVEEGTSTSTVSALEGAFKCKKKKAKVGGMEEHEGTTATVSALQGTQKCNKKEDKAKDREMAEQEATTVTVSEGTIKCKKNKEKAKETVVGDLEPSAAVSASKGAPKRKKLKKKNMMKEQQESSQALSGPVLVDKIMADKPGNSFTNGEGPSVGADVSMDPINGEDPNCSEAKDANDRVKCEAGEGIKKCSENFSSLQESSEERKTQISRAKRKRKQDACISPQDVSNLDSSMDDDCSCIYDSCLVQARKEKFTDIYSPRGSLIRFKRKKLLILDLNGLLGDINMDYRNACKAHGKVKNKLVFKRPYCDDFLEFCFENFEVGIWSSRLKDNVNAVINILMPKLKQHLLFCWDMSMCTTTGCNTLEKSFKPLVLKELKKLWNEEDPDLPWEQGEFSPSNTLLVDDSPYKAVCNPPHTAIFPQPYCYLNQRDDHSLGPGGDLRVYLSRLSAADDVQVFVQDNPFGQPSITESDPNWKFYAKIVDEVESQRP